MTKNSRDFRVFMRRLRSIFKNATISEGKVIIHINSPGGELCGVPVMVDPFMVLPGTSDDRRELKFTPTLGKFKFEI